MNSLRLFLNPIEGRQKYINKIAKNGYRLVNSGSILHSFEKTNASYRYAVQYIGYMANKERKEYSKYLNNMNFKVFSAPLNIGKLPYYYLLVVSILLIGLDIIKILDNKSIVLGAILLMIAITGIYKFNYISK